MSTPRFLDETPLPNVYADGSAGTGETYASGFHTHPDTRTIVWPDREDGLGTLSMSSVLASPDRLYVRPMLFPAPIDIKYAKIGVTTIGDADIDLAIYDIDGQHMHEDVLVTWTTASTGVKTYTFTTALRLPRGFYWLGFRPTAAPTSGEVRSWSGALVSSFWGYITHGLNAPPASFDPRAITSDGGARPFVSFSAY